jgi:hypothetical protein
MRFNPIPQRSHPLFTTEFPFNLRLTPPQDMRFGIRMLLESFICSQKHAGMPTNTTAFRFYFKVLMCVLQRNAI